MLWLLFNAISSALQLVLAALPGSLGKEVAKAFLKGRQGYRKPTGANLLLPSCLTSGQTVLVQDGNSLAAGQQPALPGTVTWPKKSQLGCYINAVLFPGSHAGVVENGFFVWLNPTSTLPLQ